MKLIQTKAIVRNLVTGEEFKVHATTDHPASSYNRAVWVTESGEALGEVGGSLLGFGFVDEADHE